MKFGKLLPFAGLVLAVGLIAGCEDSDNDDDTYRVEFDNESVSQIHVTPTGDETFQEFTLLPDEDHTVTVVGSTIEYDYTSTWAVRVDTSEPNEIIFRNP